MKDGSETHRHPSTVLILIYLLKTVLGCIQQCAFNVPFKALDWSRFRFCIVLAAKKLCMLLVPLARHGGHGTYQSGADFCLHVHLVPWSMDSSFNDSVVLDMDSFPKFLDTFLQDIIKKPPSWQENRFENSRGVCIILGGVFLGFNSDYPSQPGNGFYLKDAKNRLNSNLV